MILVIGYGNELRGDDAAGPQTAAAVAGWRLSGVQVIIQHQLTPELADPIARARAVIFVDAAAGTATRNVEAKPLDPSEPSSFGPHLSSPAALLALAHATFGAPTPPSLAPRPSGLVPLPPLPPAWIVRIPTESFVFGAPLSPTAQRGVAEALPVMRHLIEQARSLCRTSGRT
jgi:hydrogenase maturation protease